MTRTYCDNCGDEISKPKSGSRIRRERYVQPGRVIDVEVIVAWNKGWNAGHVCPKCVLLAVEHGQDVTP